MEDPDTFELVKLDPRNFFEEYKEGIIIDEAQKYLEIFSYLQGIVDKDKVKGKYILSGSQNFLLHKHISQSLAGSVDISTLFPLDFEEMSPVIDWNTSVEKVILNGFYPGRTARDIPVKMFYRNYIRTYLERDVSHLIHIGNLSAFRSFLKLIAFHCGSQINLSSLSIEVNVSANTLKSWLSILEMSYIIFMLPPYHKNFGKRVVKSPKLYFYDTGLLCYLLDILKEENVRSSEHYGILFENLVIAERKKYKAHKHIETEMFYFRDTNGLEVDLIEMKSLRDVQMFEIKGGSTFKSDFVKSMKKLNSLDPTIRMNVIYNGAENISLSDYSVFNWRNLHKN